MTETKHPSQVNVLWSGFTKTIVWIGASLSGITIVLTAFGFIVRHSYLESLGIPRTVYEAKGTEYVITGGNFIIGLIPYSVIGLANLAVNGWWLPGLIVLTAILLWRFRAGQRIRVISVTVVYGILIVIILGYFYDPTELMFIFSGADNRSVFSIFCALAVVATIYARMEWASREDKKKRSLKKTIEFIPLFMLLASTAVLLPYLKGYYSTRSSHPVIEPLGETKKILEPIAGKRPEDCKSYEECPSWQLVELGERQAILKRINDGMIIVLPAKKLEMFGILGKEIQP